MHRAMLSSHVSRRQLAPRFSSVMLRFGLKDFSLFSSQCYRSGFRLSRQQVGEYSHPGRTLSASFALVRTSTLLFALARAGPRDAIKAERKRARGRL
jgi:hypothetical protein